MFIALKSQNRNNMKYTTCSEKSQNSKSHRPTALGIEAASFASGASKDIAESPTAEL